MYTYTCIYTFTFTPKWEHLAYYILGLCQVLGR